MLSVINVCTNAIDDLDTAVEEITSQLKDKQILKNSVGIVACHFDYIEGEVTKALSEVLPFDIIGCSVFGSAINGQGGLEQLTLTILTSDDDVNFSTAISDPVSRDNFNAPVEKVYAEAKESLHGEPSMIFAICPIMSDLSGDQLLKKLDKLSSGTPIFGTLSNDTSQGYSKSSVFKNAEAGRSVMAILMISGNFKPRFYTTAIAKQNIQQQNAVVTGSEGYLVTSINGKSVLNYFASLGISLNKLAVATMIPFLVDFGDGTAPVAYSMYNTSEAGAYCGGEIPVGAMISFAEVDSNSILETAETTLQAALEDAEKNGANGIIAIPCFSRALALSPNVGSEIKKTLEVIGDKVPFSLIYSGGEICPMYNQQHGIVNRFHNLTYTLMVF